MASRGSKNIICTLSSSDDCSTLTSAVSNVNATAVDLSQKSSTFRASIAGAVSGSPSHSHHESGTDPRKSYSKESKMKNILVLAVILGFSSRSVSSVQIVAHEHDSLNYKVNKTSIDSFVSIDKETGDLKKNALERHSYNVDPLGRRSRLNVVLQLADKKQSSTFEKSVNGNKSSAGIRFTRDVYECTISEGSLPRTYLTSDEMMGMFMPSSFESSGIPDRFAGAHFQIVEGDEGGAFKVESKLVGDFVFLRIRTRSTAYINREQKNRYNLTIGARLKYFSKLSRMSGNSQYIIPAKHALDVYDVFTNVIVTVLDSNDLGPVFDKSEYFAVISDHAPLHFEVIRVVASDSDLGINSDVYYQLDNKSRSCFAIHPNLGMVMLLKHARDLESNYYELEITARDRGLQGHGRIGHTKVKVKVVPENKYAPYISVLHRTVGLRRNINAQTALAYLKISDLDLGQNGEITSVAIKGNYKEDSFELVNIDDNSAFTEDKGAEFILHAKDSVYVERHKKELIFSITATDGGMPPRSSSLEIKFSLEKNFKFPTNASRMSIAFHGSQFSTMKCHPIGTLIGYVNSSNNNNTSNISNNNHKVSSNSVRFKPVRCAKVTNVTDKECSVKGDYSLQIKCHCHGSLTHLDQMKNAFEIFEINEDVVVDFSSTFDPFEFVSVHEITGNIKISKSLRNLPTDVKKLHLLIQMESSELNDNLPSLYSVVVRIDNCNDHGPVFDEPLQDQIVVKEDVSTKTVILFAHATDEDVGNGADVIAYSILNAHVNMFTNTSVGEGFDISNDIGSILHDDPMSDNTSIFPFVIDHLSGEVFTTAPLDFDSGTRFYELYLRASDAGTPFPRHTDARPIRIIVSDVNDNPPVFNLWKISCFIPRNVVAGTLITFVRASDVDTVGGPITYQMTSISDDGNLKIELNDNEDTNCFALDGISGHLILTCDLKEITRNWFHFQVVASDGLHNSSEHLIVELKVVESRMPRYDGSMNKTTNVSDVACEESPKITKGGDWFFHKRKYNLKGASKKHPGHKKRMNQPPTIHAHQPFHVRENSARGTVFGKIEASDPDIGYNGLLQYSILQKNASDDNAHLKGWELFDVDVHSGALKVAAYLDRELLFGEVDDQNKETTLSDINHYPNVASDTGSLQRSENKSPARTISFDIVVRVCDMAKTPLCSEKMFTIILDDVNDNHPEFDMSLYRTKVKEDAGIGHFVLRIHALDRDYGINGEITYSIEGSNYFSIHPISGEIQVALNLDREFKDKHEFKVVAKDSSDDNPLSSEVAVVVVVMDVNDNRPQLLKEVFKFQILEDLPLGSVVGVIHANDPDEGNGGRILYQLLDTQSSPGEDATSSHPFSIDSTSGAIILVGDLLSGHIYNIRAKVTDKGRPPLSSEEGLVQIWVVPINRNHHEPAFKDFVRECSVRENQPAGSSVVQLQAFDQDSLDPLSPSENYKVEYSIRSGTGLGYFIIDSRGIVQTSQPLDRELASSYWLTIYAQDSAISSKGSSMYLFIRVLDENDNHPIFRQPLYRFSVAENSLPRTWVGQVEAFDADLPSKMGLTFHLVDKSSTFTIDKKTGVVRTTSEHLDREMKAEHRIEVSAKDNGEDKSLSSSTLIIITITDQNDCSPRFFDSPHLEILLPVLSFSDSTRHHRHHYRGHHYRGHRVHQTLYEGLLAVQAYDMDSGLNGNVEYSLDIHPEDSPMHRDDDDDLNGIGSLNISPFPLLRINPKSGGLMVLRTLKNDERIHAQVKAKDNGEPSLHSAIKVTIRGVDIEEGRGRGSLRFVDDSCGKVHILEDSPPFDMVCLAVAKYIGGGGDDIGRENCHIWYYISAGNDAGNFGINWKVGSLRLLRKLVRSSEPNLNLTITATDGFTVVNMMSLIHIVDSNNHDPKFENSKYHFNITLSSELDENLNKSIKIGEVKATDEDDYDDGRLFYAILAFAHSHDHNLFSIHPDSGSIFLNLEPSHNMVHGCHTFTVEAKNRPSTLRPVRQDYAQVVVCLIDDDLVNRAPEFTSNKYYGEVGWWKGVGDEVLKVKAVDGGLGSNGKVRYSLVSGNEFKLFSLDSYTGSLSLFSPISQHHLIPLQALLKDGFITMRVKATDFGSPKLSSYCSVQIKLSNFLESYDLKFDVHAPEFEISENVRLGSYVGHLTNTPSWIRVLYSLECVAENDDNYIDSHVMNHAISYQLPSDDDDPDKTNDECMFAIDTFSGVLTTLKSLDREAKDRHFLKVTASSLGSQASFNLLPSSLQGKIQTLAIIKVKDENDVRPQFHHSVYNGWLIESSKPNQYVLANIGGRRINQPLLFEVVDLDVGKNAVVGFRIVEGWADKLFEIISSESSIKSKIPLDREAILMFQYIYGDGVGSFESDEFDNLKDSDLIMSYCAKGINIKSTKSLLSDKPTGLTVPCHNLDLPIDWPSYVQLKFHIEAFDYGIPQLTSVAEVVVEVHDINDSPPTFYGGLLDEVIIWPPLVPGFRVFKVKALDLDFKGSKLKYNFDEDAMHPLGMKYFHLDESTGWLSVTNELCDDHAFCFFDETQFLGHNNLKWMRGEESHQNFKFTLKVKVTDGRFQSKMAIVIKIIDSSFVPTNMTKVSKDYSRFQYGDLIYNAEVLENTRGKQLLTRLKIVSESLTFSLLNHDDLFTVHSHSGIVETKDNHTFDREATDKYDILIDVKDHLLAHVTRCLVKVTVKDVNDNPPLFFGLPYIVVVDVNTPKRAVLFQPIVKDFDLGSNSELRFSLVYGNASIFVVDKSSGQILLNGLVFNLIGQKFSIIIKAEDSGTPSLSSEAGVTFYFKGDIHPYFNPPVMEISVNMDHPPFTGFAYVTANSYREARIVYNIDDGGVDDGNGRIPQLRYFDVDLDSGSLVLLRDISHMIGRSISLVVRATDVKRGFHGDLKATINIVGNIGEVPVFDKISYKIFVTPFLQEGQVILEPNVTGSNLEFKLTPSRYRPRFSYNEHTISVDFRKMITIDPKFGLIKVGKVMDFEQLCLAGRADFTISAHDSSDSTLLTSSAVVTILPFNSASSKIYFNSKIYETKLKIPPLRSNESMTKSKSLETSIARVSASILGNCDCIEGNNSQVLFYSLVGNTSSYLLNRNKLLQFSIDRDTGIIKAAIVSVKSSSKEAMLPPVVILNVTASSMLGSMDFAHVRVKIEMETLEGPRFSSSLYFLNFNGSMPPGNILLTTTVADDGSRNDFRMLNFEIESDDDRIANVFQINSQGQIYIKEGLMGLQRNHFKFYIKVTDQNGFTGESKVKVDISNDYHFQKIPAFNQTAYVVNVNLGADVGATVFKIETPSTPTEVLEMDHEKIKLNVLPEDCLHENGEEYFYFVDRSLNVARTLTQIGNYSFKCYMKASNSVGQSNPVQITINVASNNFEGPTYGHLLWTNLEPPPIKDAPNSFYDMLEFELDYYVFHVAENLEWGHHIGQVRLANSFTEGRIVFTLKGWSNDNNLGNINDFFILNKNTGILTSATSFDFELTQTFDFQVVAHDSRRKMDPLEVQVRVNIINLNDNDPIFIKPEEHKVSLREDANVGMTLMKLSTMDSDHSSGPILFIKRGDPCGRFDLSPLGELILKKALDREVVHKYKLDVVAYDGWKMTETTVEVDVLNANDNHPICRDIPYQITLMENATIGTNILRINATDPDDDADSESSLTHVIEPMKNVEHGDNYNYDSTDLFSINRVTGSISLKGSLDRETNPKHVFWVRSSDQGGHFCRSKVEVTVKDVDDNPPRFLKLHYEGKVEENGGIGVAVMKVLAFDPDEERNALFRYYLTDHHLPPQLPSSYSSSSSSSLTTFPSSSSYFSIHQQTGLITTKMSFDREKQNLYNLTAFVVSVTSHEQSEEISSVHQWSSASISITISDVNDNPPLFTSTFYTFTVLENTTVGTTIGLVKAVSIDEGLNALVTYAILSFDPEEGTGEYLDLPEYIEGSCGSKECRNGIITVDSKTGHLTLRTSLDYEKVKNYHFMVMAYDSGIPPLSSITKVSVIVEDVNDNAPFMLHDQYELEVYENKSVGDWLMQVSALDKDSGLNAVLRFKITAGNVGETFHMDEATGILSLQKPLDREEVAFWILRIDCFDLGMPSLTGHSSIRVTILDVNDCTPQLSANSLKGLNISEQMKPGQFLRQLVIEDCDERPNSFPFKHEIIHVGYDAHDWVEHCKNYSTTPTGRLRTLKSAENIFFIDTQGRLFSTNKTETYLKNIGFFMKDKSRNVQEKVMILIKIADNGDISLSSCSLIPISLLAPPWKFPHGEEISIISFSLEPLKVLLNLYPKSGETRFESDNDLTWPAGQLCQVKAIAKVVRSNSTFILNGSSEHRKEFDVRYSISRPEDGGDNKKEAHKNNIQQIFSVNEKSGAIHSMIPLDPGTYKFLTKAALKFNDDDHDHEGLIKKEHKTENIVTVVVEVLSESMLDEAVAVKFSNTIEQSASGDEDDYKNYNASLPSSSSSSLVTELASGLVDVLKQRKGLDAKILGIDFKLRHDEQSRRSKRSTSSSALEWVELLISATNSDHEFGLLNRTELHNTLHNIKSQLEENSGLRVVSIAFSGNSHAPLSCDKNNDCVHKKCDVTFTIDTTSSVPIKLLDSHLQIVPKFYKKVLCLCPHGERIHESGLCQSMKVNPTKDFKPEKGAAPDDDGNDDIADITNDASMTFNGQSYFAWHAAIPLERKLFISLDIKTNQTRARLLHLAGHMDYSFLEIESGYIQFLWNFGSGPGKVRIQGQKVSDGRWHHVTLERSGINVRLVLDSSMVLDAVAIGNSDVLNLEDNKIIFGGEVNYVDNANTDVRFGFIGCMRNIKLNGVELFLTGSSSMQGYLVNMGNIRRGCEVETFAGVCSSRPCLNGGSCMPVDQRSFVCDCPEAFQGKLCEKPFLPHKSTNPCLSSSPNPCLNSGTCKPMSGMQYKCSCTEGYRGVHCEILSSMATKETGIADVGHLFHVVVVVMIVTASITVVLVVTIVCLCRTSKRKKQEEASFNSDSRKQNKLNNLIANMQLKREDLKVDPDCNVHKSINCRSKKQRSLNNCNNSNNRFDFFGRDLREELKIDNLELEPLQGHLSPEHEGSSKLSLGAEFHSNYSLSMKKNYFDGNTSESARTRETLKGSKASTFVSCRPRNSSSTNPVAFNLYQLDKRTMSENVNVNRGSFDRSLVPLELKMVKGTKGLSQLSTPAKLHSGFEEKCPKSLDIFSTKQSLEWDSRDLKPGTSSHHFQSSSGLTSECGGEKFFDTTLESEHFEVLPADELDASTDNDLPLFVKSGQAITKADPSLYQTTFISKNDDQ